MNREHNNLRNAVKPREGENYSCTFPVELYAFHLIFQYSNIIARRIGEPNPKQRISTHLYD